MNHNCLFISLKPGEERKKLEEEKGIIMRFVIGHRWDFIWVQSSFRWKFTFLYSANMKKPVSYGLCFNKLLRCKQLDEAFCCLGLYSPDTSFIVYNLIASYIVFSTWSGILLNFLPIQLTVLPQGVSLIGLLKQKAESTVTFWGWYYPQSFSLSALCIYVLFDKSIHTRVFFPATLVFCFDF